MLQLIVIYGVSIKLVAVSCGYHSNKCSFFFQVWDDAHRYQERRLGIYRTVARQQVWLRKGILAQTKISAEGIRLESL